MASTERNKCQEEKVGDENMGSRECKVESTLSTHFRFFLCVLLYLKEAALYIKGNGKKHKRKRKAKRSQGTTLRNALLNA